MVSHNQTQREMHKLFLRKVSLLKTYSDRKINKLVDAMTVEEFQVRKCEPLPLRSEKIIFFRNKYPNFSASGQKTVILGCISPEGDELQRMVRDIFFSIKIFNLLSVLTRILVPIRLMSVFFAAGVFRIKRCHARHFIKVTGAFLIFLRM